MDSRKKRGANYTETERAALLEIVKKYSNIIECKQSDNVSIKKKQETWKTIENEFNTNSCVNVPREWKQLRILWDNLKRKMKKIVANENKMYLEKLASTGFSEADLQAAKSKVATNSQGGSRKPLKKKLRLSTDQLKQKYFKRKLFNANLQTKFLIKEHKIQMEIHSLQLKKLKETVL